MPLRQWLLQIAVQRVFVQDQGRGAVPMPCWPRHSGATETGRRSCHEQTPPRPLRHGWSKGAYDWRRLHLQRGPERAHGPRTQTKQRRSEAASMRSEEHTSELQSLMRISYAVFCLKKKNNINTT